MNRPEVEEQILSSTVRLQFDYWIVYADERGYLIEHSVAHGTVKEDRYIVTHNHFGHPFAGCPEFANQDIFTQVQVYDAAGTLLTSLSLDDVVIVVQEPETLVLDFGESGGLGFFKALGVQSADFASQDSFPLPVGAEISQVNWDGTRTRINWTSLQQVQEEQGTARLVLAGGLDPGASGGGVFWQGTHIGNNWMRVDGFDSQGLLISQFNIAASNSRQVSGLEFKQDVEAVQ